MIDEKMKLISNQLNNPDNYISLFGYSKTPECQSGIKTGKSLILNNINNLCIIDFDIYDETYFDSIYKVLPKNNSIIVKSCHNGIHIYAYNDVEYLFTKNQYQKLYATEKYAIDLFVSSIKNKRQLINVPVTKVRDTKTKRKIKTYEFLNNSFSFDFNLIKLTELISILNKNSINIKLPEEQEKVFIDDNYVLNNNIKEQVDKELIDKCIEYICECEIHNDATHSIKTEISLLPLFSGLNSLINIENITKHDIKNYYNYIYENGNLTANAKNKYWYQQSRFSDKHSNFKCLLSMLKLHNTKRFNELYKTEISFDLYILDTDDIINNTPIGFINLKNNICLENMSMKNYLSIIMVQLDLKQCFASIISKNNYLLKIKQDKSYILDYRSLRNIKEIFKQYKVFINEQIASIWDIYQYNTNIYNYSDIKFYSDEPDEFSHFQGYKYKYLESINLELIQPFLDHIKYVICDFEKNIPKIEFNENVKNYKTLFNYDNGVYSIVDNINNATHYSIYDSNIYNDYVIKWFAYILQNIDSRTDIAILLKSKQGCGKNIFTNVLCELLYGYSEFNITDINDLISQNNSVIENKKLIICNELQDTTNAKSYINYDVLKSLWTDNKQRIGEKYVAKHTIDNVINGILCTNNTNSFKIEDGDRRYLCLECNDKYKGKIIEYFAPLINSIKHDDFYNNLFTYFMNVDISDFNPQIIPPSILKQDMTILSNSTIEEFINDYYEELHNEGIKLVDIFDNYISWCNEFKYTPEKRKYFNNKIKNILYDTLNKNKEHIWKIK